MMSLARNTSTAFNSLGKDFQYVNASGYENSFVKTNFNTSNFAFRNAFENSNAYSDASRFAKVNRSGYAANSSTNETIPTFSCLLYVPMVLPITLYAIIILLSLVGNSLTVSVIINGKLIKKSAHRFLLNMAIADLVVTIVYMPRMIARYVMGRGWFVHGTFGLVLCRAMPFLHHVTILVSVFTILAATVDRFCAIVCPLRNIMTRSVTTIIIIATWILSAILRFPYLVTPKLKLSNSAIVCATNLQAVFGDDYRVYERILMSVYSSSLLVTILLYTVIIIQLKRAKQQGTHTNEKSQLRKDVASRKLVKMLIVITICFILCWSIYFFAFDIFNRPLDCIIGLVRFILAHSNSALNPVILCVFNRHYRTKFIRTAKGVLEFRKKRSTVKAFGGDVATLGCKKIEESMASSAKSEQRHYHDFELSVM